MPLTILVVEDDLGTRLAITDYLELSGYSAIPAVNGRNPPRHHRLSGTFRLLSDSRRQRPGGAGPA